MIEIQESATFGQWMRRLRDSRARARIVARIQRMAQGNLGDAKPIGGGLSELRIHYGPGYRVYFMPRGDALIIQCAAATRATRHETSIRQDGLPQTG
jgi:putative addiction module killer protein